MQTRLVRLALALVSVGMLAGCSSALTDSSFEEVQAAIYVPEDAPRVTLLSIINNETGHGGHSALVVSASQKIIFDPAGSFVHPDVPRRKDVLYGITPAWEQGYKSAHARSTFHVVSQDIPVTAQQAERVLQLVLSAGPVSAAFCANANATILRQIPGYEDIQVTFFPDKLMMQLEDRPEITTERYYENDEGGVVDGIPAAQL